MIFTRVAYPQHQDCMLMILVSLLLLLTSHDPTDLHIKLNSDLNKIQSWLQANKLSLNVKKTKYTIIATQYKIAHRDH